MGFTPFCGVDLPIEHRVTAVAGHTFSVLTNACTCGYSASSIFDAKRPKSHADVLNPGTVEAVYRRKHGNPVAYRKRVT